MSRIYWNKQFRERQIPHSEQNDTISEDFIKSDFFKNEVYNLLKNSTSVLELGCGTGEFSKKIYDMFGIPTIGTDISEEAISFANKNFANNNLKYEYKGFEDINNNFDFCICSNVLEHFKNPFIWMDKFINLSKYFLILVPYNQPTTDGYDNEGGAGHVFCFTEQTFDKYNVLNFYKFKTNGWQHSSCGEDPMQLAIVLKGKL